MQAYEWIKVSDKFPTYGTEVLTIDNDKQQEVLSYNTIRKIWFNAIGDDYQWSKLITHWMPLPEPPEGL